MSDLIDPGIIGLGLALGLGFLVGLEREWASRKPMGLRSFALIGLTGGLTGLLAQPWGGWVVAAGLLGVAGVAVTHLALHRAMIAGDAEDHGTTTLMAALAIFLIGTACTSGYQPHAVVAGGTITILLHWKQPLHGWVERLGGDEFSAVIRFVLVTLVILPVLPNDTYGPYDVFNPFEAWLLVVLIVGMNLGGYIAFRLFSADSGAIAGGILGGLVSSTATTVSFSVMTRRNEALAPSAALIILLASTVVYARIGVELLLVAPGLLPHAAAPLGAFTVVMLAVSAALLPRVRRRRVALPEQENPARLHVALTFAALYTVIIFAVAAAQEHVGDDAIYAVAFVSGLTDVDAMTLSVAQLFQRGEVDADPAWRSIFLASLANLLFKIGAASVLGVPALRRYLLALGGGALIAGIAVLLLWPRAIVVG
ncbi:MAG: MgtC/SapB family protein [Pseudomonadota bacterium]